MPQSILAKITQLLAGDRSAVAWLYDAFAPRLLRRLGMRFGEVRGLDCEDLLQDTFVYVLKEEGRVLERFRTRYVDDEPEAWDLEHFLWCAACGIASNRRRSLVRHPSASIEGRELMPNLAGESPAIARDALERLGDCLFRSGTRLRLYFQLRYRDGHKPAEISAITGWSQRATYKLKRALDEALERCVDELELGAS